MKKVIVIVAFAALVAAAAVAGEYEVTAAWAGSLNSPPSGSGHTPQWLVSNAEHTLSSGEIAKLDEDGGWDSYYCYHFYETYDREHDWVMCKIEDISYATVYLCRWRADGRDNEERSRAFFWDGENWDPTPYGVENEGGTDPEAVTCHVEDYIQGGTLLVLFANWSWEEGDGDFAVTWADVITQ
jgi:hypothetical protein